MDQKWLEMDDFTRRRLSKATWVPLRSSQKVAHNGEFGHVGFIEDFYGVGSLAIPVGLKEKTQELGWEDIGLAHSHRSGIQDGRYFECDRHVDLDGALLGIPLVLEQDGSGLDHRVWHLHQDLVIALGLLREKDDWLLPDEGYETAVRLKRNSSGQPISMEIRQEYLRDYLCAREFGLFVSSYRSRRMIVDDVTGLDWNASRLERKFDIGQWRGLTYAIHEGGMPYGEQTAVFRASRSDVHVEDDVPEFEFTDDKNTESSHYTFRHAGQKLIVASGECWLNEWIDPGQFSPRIRQDPVPGTIHFITDASGARETKETLEAGMKYLWFRADVVPALLRFRSASLTWYSRNTGDVKCSPQQGIHVGVNSVGLINVFAKDIAQLPDWQQRIWVAHNVSPEGGVSEELLASQMRCDPADTSAPETRFAQVIQLLAQPLRHLQNLPLVREHVQQDQILTTIHRFRSLDQSGLFALAKDIARMTADSFELKHLHSVVKPPKGDEWRTLRSLKECLSKRIELQDAERVVAPLVGAYELRLNDAHLPTKSLSDAMGLAGLSADWHFVEQGTRLIENCADSLEKVHKLLSE